MMTEFSGLYCCGLSVFTGFPDWCSTAEVCFCYPDWIQYSCSLFLLSGPTVQMWPRFVFTVPTEFSTAVREFVFTVPAAVSREFSTARHWIQYRGRGLFSLSPDGIEYSFVFRPTAVPTESSMIGDWAIGTRYQVLRISDWLTLFCLLTEWTFWTVLFQVFWQKCLSPIETPPKSVCVPSQLSPALERRGRTRRPPTENNKK